MKYPLLILLDVELLGIDLLYEEEKLEICYPT